MIKYSRRAGTNGDLAPTRDRAKSQLRDPAPSYEAVQDGQPRRSGIGRVTSAVQCRLTVAGYAVSSQALYVTEAGVQANDNTFVAIIESLGLLVLVIALIGLVNALTMGVIERTREFGSSCLRHWDDGQATELYLWPVICRPVICRRVLCVRVGESGLDAAQSRPIWRGISVRELRAVDRHGDCGAPVFVVGK
jgi:hypothetical protein